MGKRSKNKKKSKLPVFHSDDDFLKEFENENHLNKKKEKTAQPDMPPSDIPPIDRHGVPILDSSSSYGDFDEDAEMDFAQLLEESYKTNSSKKEKPKPLSLKKRLKRYPPVELELDLHGFT